MPLEVIRYECVHCEKKLYKSPAAAKVHEKKCFWNPVSKACMTCMNYQRGGHYGHSCYHQHMNTNEEIKVNRTIKKLQHNCNLYEYDKMNNEERKQVYQTNNSDAQADIDDYNANRM